MPPAAETDDDDVIFSEVGSELDEDETLQDLGLEEGIIPHYDRSQDYSMAVLPATESELTQPSEVNPPTFSPETRLRLHNIQTRIIAVQNRPENNSSRAQSRREADLWKILQEADDPDEQIFLADWMMELATSGAQWQPSIDPNDTDSGPPPAPGTETYPPKATEEIPQEIPALTDPPQASTYEEALAFLPGNYGEQHLLFSMGSTVADVQRVLRAMQVPQVAEELLLATWPSRRHELLMIPKDIRVYKKAGPPVTLDPPLDPEAEARRAAEARMAQRRRNCTNGNNRQKYQRLSIPSTLTGEESALQKEVIEYRDLTLHMIREARTFGLALGYSPFPLVQHFGTSEPPELVIAAVYGQVLTGKKNGGRRQLKGLRQRWSRTRRFLDALIDRGSQPDALFICQFIDTTNYKGFGEILAWAGRAFGLPQFTAFAEEPVIRTRQPGTGWGIDRPAPAPKHAPWIPDLFINYLADQCHAPRVNRRRKAFYFYLSALGGVRWQDSQHVTQLRIIGEGSGACILFTASRFKATTSNQEEQFAIPLYDYRGRSMLTAAADLLDQMGDGYLLAAPVDLSITSDPIKGRPCPYQKTTDLLRSFASEWQAGLPDGHIYKNMDLSEVTLHSFKGWLDTLGKQAHFPEDHIEVLLHWSSTKMHRRYNRNPLVEEVYLRQIVVALLQSDWRSAGLGFQADLQPPDIRTIKPVTPAATGRY